MIEQIKLVLNSSQEQLRSVPYVESLIQQFGLFRDDRRLYGEPYNQWMLPEPSCGGLWQQPRQLAEALVWLSDKNIKTYLDIGTFYGYTYTFITCYLCRFGLLQATGIDVQRWFDPKYYDVVSHVPCSFNYGLGNSHMTVICSDYQWDLVFIDGNHYNLGPFIDYENAGQYARFCMIHDINDEYVSSPRDLWNSLQGKKIEFTYHPEGRRVMGIGIIEK